MFLSAIYPFNKIPILNQSYKLFYPELYFAIAGLSGVAAFDSDSPREDNSNIGDEKHLDDIADSDKN